MPLPPSVTLIHKGHFHLLPRHFLHLLTEGSHLGPFLFTGRRYYQGQQMPQGIYRQVNFASLASFVPIVSGPLPTLRGGL
ncbi:MAG: hypothetical protein KatS3mg070_1997 [Meiothermus sp.]|nr:MAG: hypothetical protein KatS3mg070_1997 [Meiothermus sp.]